VGTAAASVASAASAASAASSVLAGLSTHTGMAAVAGLPFGMTAVAPAECSFIVATILSDLLILCCGAILRSCAVLSGSGVVVTESSVGSTR
jgi:hypothetical protein